MRARAAVLVALAVSAAMVPSVMSGAMDPATALLRFLIALVASYLGVSAVARVAERYSAMAGRRPRPVGREDLEVGRDAST